jgi:hypothetical protein
VKQLLRRPKRTGAGSLVDDLLEVIDKQVRAEGFRLQRRPQVGDTIDVFRFQFDEDVNGELSTQLSFRDKPSNHPVLTDVSTEIAGPLKTPDETRSESIATAAPLAAPLRAS